MDPFKIYLMLALIGLIAAAAYRRRRPPQPT
jgi:MYXO-CTERM domain-containing protein